MNLPTITVSQLNTYIKKMFDADLTFASVLLSGEISNLSPHYRSGHLYFSLKDANAGVKAVMFASDAARLRFRPENGMKVIAAGRVGVFERDGVYQIYVRQLIPDGAGALAAAFEQRKAKLLREGLFDAAHKRPLPPMPRRIGVITSPTGAALQDILKVLRRRYPLGEVVLAGVTVQGANAPGEITAAIRAFDRLRAADVILLARGGGSAEDLWCFNDEAIARAIYDCSIPIVTGIGHEVDVTIADYAADLRAPTPSAAAEMAAPDIAGLIAGAEALFGRLSAAAGQTLRRREEQRRALAARLNARAPGVYVASQLERLSLLSAALKRAAAGEGEARRRRLSLGRLALDKAAQGVLYENTARFSGAYQKLKTLNPLDVLLRGYAVVYAGEAIASSAAEIGVGDRVDVRLRDGVLKCEVKEKEGVTPDGGEKE